MLYSNVGIRYSAKHSFTSRHRRSPLHLLDVSGAYCKFVSPRDSLKHLVTTIRHYETKSICRKKIVTTLANEFPAKVSAIRRRLIAEKALCNRDFGSSTKGLQVVEFNPWGFAGACQYPLSVWDVKLSNLIDYLLC